MNKLIYLLLVVISLFSSCALTVDNRVGGDTTVYITQTDSSVVIYKHGTQSPYVLKKEPNGQISDSTFQVVVSEIQIQEAIMKNALDIALQRKGMERYILGEENNVCDTNPFLIYLIALLTFSTFYFFVTKRNREKSVLNK
jgi:hypothetical protein